MRTHGHIYSLLTPTLPETIPAASQTLVKEGSPDFVAVHQLASDIDSAWNRRDPKGFSELFLNDGDFQFDTGQMLRGREQITDYYATSLFPSMPAEFRHKTKRHRLRYLTPDVVIGDGSVLISRAGAVEEEEPHPSLLFTCVAVKRDGKWHIAAVRLMVPQEEPPN